ncbi:Hypothetical predicted protein [Olea europaea subsp. europaea]|uniref:Uncharacterized protein n=1 Tax=Olea europaea subsp. europaea TaxID=158383 RepID=A0A8S0T4Q5_OLEEU|nr:Hypothetical predicted protein [Olea europaea subsp. europaea]
MAETSDSAAALKMTSSPSQSQESVPSPKLQSSNEGEIKEAFLDDANNDQNNSLLLLKEPECGFSGYDQDSKVEMKTLHCCGRVVQDSPSGDVAYGDALVSSEMIIPEIQGPPSSCVAMFADDAFGSRTLKEQEGNFADDTVDLINVKKQKEECADGAIDAITVKEQGGHFSDGVIDSVTVKKQEQLDSLEKRLKIQVIDETALIESPCLGIGKRQETQVAKEKRQKRRRSKAAKNVETSGTGSQDCNYIGNKGKKRLVYSRKEMEALRFVGLEAQKNKWIEIYCRLGPLVAKEYDELTHHQKHNATGFDFDPRPQFLRASVPSRSFGEGCPELADSASCFPGSDELDCSLVEVECSEDDTTDEDYSSVQKPAFFVKGEPDFDSGPPQDGLEYLRRVRWEAEQIPKVKVAKVDKNKVNKEQTVYMPQIPDIMKCPDNLLPLKQWEDSFLADFSKLRLGLVQLEIEGSSAKVSAKSQSNHEEEMVDQISESMISENFDNLSVEDNSSIPETDDAKVDSHSPETSSSSINSPTLSMILKMDSVARVSMLKRRISSVESLNTLSRDDCLWLFALCAAVDCPLDADTCAALRSLLRKCASLRAAKSELDDDVIMLNILMTISGRYFGQLEN